MKYSLFKKKYIYVYLTILPLHLNLNTNYIMSVNYDNFVYKPSRLDAIEDKITELPDELSAKIARNVSSIRNQYSRDPDTKKEQIKYEIALQRRMVYELQRQHNIQLPNSTDERREFYPFLKECLDIINMNVHKNVKKFPTGTQVLIRKGEDVFISGDKIYSASILIYGDLLPKELFSLELVLYYTNNVLRLENIRNIGIHFPNMIVPSLHITSIDRLNVQPTKSAVPYWTNMMSEAYKSRYAPDNFSEYFNVLFEKGSIKELVCFMQLLKHSKFHIPLRVRKRVIAEEDKKSKMLPNPADYAFARSKGWIKTDRSHYNQAQKSFEKDADMADPENLEEDDDSGHKSKRQRVERGGRRGPFGYLRQLSTSLNRLDRHVRR